MRAPILPRVFSAAPDASPASGARSASTPERDFRRFYSLSSHLLASVLCEVIGALKAQEEHGAAITPTSTLDVITERLENAARPGKGGGV